MGREGSGSEVGESLDGSEWLLVLGPYGIVRHGRYYFCGSIYGVCDDGYGWCQGLELALCCGEEHGLSGALWSRFNLACRYDYPGKEIGRLRMLVFPGCAMSFRFTQCAVHLNPTRIQVLFQSIEDCQRTFHIIQNAILIIPSLDVLEMSECSKIQ